MPPRRAAGPRRCAGRRGTGSPVSGAARTHRRRAPPERRRQLAGLPDTLAGEPGGLEERVRRHVPGLDDVHPLARPSVVPGDVAALEALVEHRGIAVGRRQDVHEPAGKVRAGAGTVGGSKIEVVKLTLEQAWDRRLDRMRVEQDGDTEPFLQRGQLCVELTMIGMPVCPQPAADFDRIWFTAVAVQRGEVESAGRTEFGIVTAAIKCVSLGVPVEVDDIARLCRREEADAQGRREVVQSVQMPVRIADLMSRVGHRFRDIQRDVGADMGQAD